MAEPNIEKVINSLQCFEIRQLECHSMINTSEDSTLLTKLPLLNRLNLHLPFANPNIYSHLFKNLQEYNITFKLTNDRHRMPIHMSSDSLLIDNLDITRSFPLTSTASYYDFGV